MIVRPDQSFLPPDVVVVCGLAVVTVVAGGFVVAGVRTLVMLLPFPVVVVVLGALAVVVLGATVVVVVDVDVDVDWFDVDWADLVGVPLEQAASRTAPMTSTTPKEVRRTR